MSYTKQVLRGLRGMSYDLITWPPTTAARLSIVICPGNPGLAGYYTHFADELSRLLPDAAIYCIGHLGQSPAAAKLSLFGGPAFANLEEQIEHKCHFVDSLDASLPVVMIGHSIGAHISSQTMKRRPNRVASVHMLFPTISHMRMTPNGRRLAPLFSKWTSLPLAASTTMLSFWPKSVLNLLVGVLARQEGPGVEVTTALVSSPGAVASAIFMARCEMDEVKEVDEELLRQYGRSMRWYWAEGDTDGWVLPSSIDEIERILDDAGHDKSRRIRCEEGMQHAFVLDSNHCDSLAKKCANWIKEDVQDAIRN